MQTKLLWSAFFFDKLLLLRLHENNLQNHGKLGGIFSTFSFLRRMYTSVHNLPYAI